MKITVIIPVYKPGKELFDLLDRLECQTVKPEQVILINTEKKYFDALMMQESPETADFEKRYPFARVIHITKAEFDHGGTRHRGTETADGDILVFMTQDALPRNSFLLENLTKHLSGDVAAAYARQLPRKNAAVPEQISRSFNYPEESCVKGKEDLERLGIKTYFCSNVCAAYRKDLYEQLGGFVRKTIFNEDMLFAAKAVQAGYRIAYESDAQVVHSHNYSCTQQLHRNFDLGVSQAQHPEVFSGIRSEAEGKKYVKAVIAALKKEHHALQIPGFCMNCGFKYAGYLLGKHYKKLPKGLVRRLSDNKSYWG